MRTYASFAYKETRLRISSDMYGVITEAAVRFHKELAAYIVRNPAFLHSLVPIKLQYDAPRIAYEMARAATLAGVGPMAAVAGAIAEACAREAILAGAAEAIVENGGDIFLYSKEKAVVGLFAGCGTLSETLAFEVEPSQMPLAVCSSSGVMGHSLSLGLADLAAVVAPDCALADAAATAAGNVVRSEEDIEPALERVMRIEGVKGVLVIKGERIGMAGDLPRLIRNRDSGLSGKITRNFSPQA